MTQLSKNLSLLRKKNNLTQEELGARLGVSSQSISKWENNISMPDICLLPMIAETLGASIDELFGINNANTLKITDDFPEQLHAEILENIASWFGEADAQNACSKYTDEGYEDVASVIFTKKGAVFENKSIGIVFPKAPNDAIKLIQNSDAEKYISFLSDKSVLIIINYLASTKQFATISSISNKCSLTEEAVRSTLEKIQDYQLVIRQAINLEDEEIEVWRIQRTHTLLFIYTIFEIAKQASKPEDNYFYYHGNDHWCY